MYEVQIYHLQLAGFSGSAVPNRWLVNCVAQDRQWMKLQRDSEINVRDGPRRHLLFDTQRAGFISELPTRLRSIMKRFWVLSLPSDEPSIQCFSIMNFSSVWPFARLNWAQLSARLPGNPSFRSYEYTNESDNNIGIVEQSICRINPETRANGLFVRPI